MKDGNLQEIFTFVSRTRKLHSGNTLFVNMSQFYNLGEPTGSD
jgi:hypothetical protein